MNRSFIYISLTAEELSSYPLILSLISLDEYFLQSSEYPEDEWITEGILVPPPDYQQGNNGVNSYMHIFKFRGSDNLD